MREFRLPDIGEGLAEAEIVKWHVPVGGTVAMDETIVEVETTMLPVSETRMTGTASAWLPARSRDDEDDTEPG